ncbi:MAG: hypothetical protein C9356_15695 [Oleiphilus sp.]|nr:MAG: hypothetical protein C9356_15695 [Oleiphilus sp.]
MQKWVYRYQSDPAFKKNVHIFGGIAAFLLVMYLLQTGIKKLAEEPPPVEYKTDITRIMGEPDNPYQQQGMTKELEELKAKYQQGSKTYDKKIDELNQRVTRLSEANANLSKEKVEAFKQAEKQFMDKLEIIDQQYEQRHKQTLQQIGLGGKGVEYLQRAARPEQIAATSGAPQTPKPPPAKPVELTEYELMMADYRDEARREERERAKRTADETSKGDATSETTSINRSGTRRPLSLSIVSNEGLHKVADTGYIELEPNASHSAATSKASEQASQVAGEEEMPEPKQVLAAGSLMSGLLINGVYAPTHTSASAEETPVLMRIKKEAILPNRKRLDMRECLLIGSGFGQLNTSRVNIRARLISCIKEDGGAIEIPVEAYAVGSDGQLGVRGRIISRNDRVLFNSTINGALSGLSEALAPSEVPVLFDTGDDNKMYQSARLSDVGAIAGYNGASEAFKNLSDYYRKLLDNLHPVIEIAAGENIEMIILKGVEIAI